MQIQVFNAKQLHCTTPVAMFVLGLSIVNLAGRSNDRIQSTNPHWIGSDPKYANKNNKKYHNGKKTSPSFI